MEILVPLESLTQIDLTVIIRFTLIVVVTAVISYVAFVPRSKKSARVGRCDTKLEPGENLKIVTMSSFQLTWGSLGILSPWNRTPGFEKSHEFAQKNGRLLKTRFPSSGKYLVNSEDLAVSKKVMTSNLWSDRVYQNFYTGVISFGKNIGILFANGEGWRESRKVTLKLLHQLNFFNNANIEERFAQECLKITENLGGKIVENGGEFKFSPNHMYILPTLNIICEFIMGKRFESDDPLGQRVLTLLHDCNKEFKVCYGILDAFPFLKNWPKLTYLGVIQKLCDLLYGIVQQEADQRRSSGSYQTNPQDLLDHLLLEVDIQSCKSPNYLNLESVLVIMRDLILGGSDTTASAMEHMLLHLSANPDMQSKIQAEIDEVIGAERMPSYEDKSRMIYTQATILEVLRLGSPIPMTARTSTEDTELLGTQISKDTMFAVNIYGIHRSPELWSDPETFRPERFIDELGNLTNTNKIIPFGHGKRGCIGESMGRIGIFMFTVSILQKFNLFLSPDHALPSFTHNQIGLSRSPLPFWVNVTRRRS